MDTIFTPKAKPAHTRTISLTQSKRHGILRGVNFTYTDFTPAAISYVPYINEGIKKEDKSLARNSSSWLNRPTCKFSIKTNISKIIYFMQVLDKTHWSKQQIDLFQSLSTIRSDYDQRVYTKLL